MAFIKSVRKSAYGKPRRYRSIAKAGTAAEISAVFREIIAVLVGFVDSVIPDVLCGGNPSVCIVVIVAVFRNIVYAVLAHFFIAHPVGVNCRKHFVHCILFLFIYKGVKYGKRIAHVCGTCQHKAEGGVPAAAVDQVSALLKGAAAAIGYSLSTVKRVFIFLLYRIPAFFCFNFYNTII